MTTIGEYLEDNDQDTEYEALKNALLEEGFKLDQKISDCAVSADDLQDDLVNKYKVKHDIASLFIQLAKKSKGLFFMWKYIHLIIFDRLHY